MKESDGQQCSAQNESYTYNISYIELTQEHPTSQFETLTFQGQPDRSATIQVPISLLIYNSSNNGNCIGWIGINQKPNIFSTQMLPYYPQKSVSINQVDLYGPL